MVGKILTMVGIGVATAVGEEIANGMQKPNVAKWIALGGGTGTALMSLGLVVEVIDTVASCFGKY